MDKINELYKEICKSKEPTKQEIINIIENINKGSE